MPEKILRKRGRPFPAGPRRPGTEQIHDYMKMEIRATPSIRAASVMAITMMEEEAPGLRP